MLNRDSKESPVMVDVSTADARCMIQIGIAGKSTTSSWYEIWEAMVAVVTICVRNDKAGKAKSIGEHHTHINRFHVCSLRSGLHKNIFIELTDEYPDLHHVRTNISDNVSSALEIWGGRNGSEISLGNGRGANLSVLPVDDVMASDESSDPSVTLSSEANSKGLRTNQA